MNFSILMLQEIQTHYKGYFQPMDLMGYHKHMDSLCKTGIYIKDGTDFEPIKLKEIAYGSRVEDILYATSIIVKLKMGSQQKYIVILNLIKTNQLLILGFL